MSQMYSKLKLIACPFLLIAALLIIGYSFLNWYLFIETYPFLLKEEVRNFMIPMALPWIPLIIWFRPRLKRLKFKKTARSPETVVIMLASFTIIASMVVAQEYIATATGKLTRLESVNEIPQTKETRYYELKNYVIDNVYTGTHFKRVVSGKQRQYLDLTFFIVCPIYDKGQLPAMDIRNVPHHLMAPAVAGDIVPPAPLQDSNSLPLFHMDEAGDHKVSPLIVIDGRVTDGASLTRLSPDSVSKVRVLKGNAAQALFGKRGVNGVVMVTTKKYNMLDPNTPAAEPTRIHTIEQDSSYWPPAWVGIKYTRQISNKLSPDDKEDRIVDFKKTCWADYASRKTTGYTYFDEIPYNNDYVGFQKAASSTDRYSTQGPFRLLEPKEEAFDQRNGSKLPWVFGSFLIGSSILLIVLVLTPLKKQEEESLPLEGGKENFKDSVRSAFEILIPKDKYYWTPIIIDINLVIFTTMVVSGLGLIEFDSKSLVRWGASYGPLVSSGEWWRLLTSTFLHAGILHLVVNMYALLFVGLFLEPVLGKTRFAVSYLATGLVASLVSYLVHPMVVAVGASGAIFGMYGIFLALLLRGVFPPGFKKAFLFSTVIFVGFNLLAGLSGNIDNAAHIGGLLCGFFIGLFMSGSANRGNEDVL